MMDPMSWHYTNDPLRRSSDSEPITMTPLDKQQQIADIDATSRHR